MLVDFVPEYEIKPILSFLRNGSNFVEDDPQSCLLSELVCSIFCVYLQLVFESRARLWLPGAVQGSLLILQGERS